MSAARVRRATRSSGRFARALALAGPLGAALASAGCGGEEATASWRWIEAPPLHAIAASDFREVECVERFEFPDGDLPAGLELAVGARVAGLGSGLTVRGGMEAPRLVLTRVLPAGSAAALRVTVAGVRRGKVKALWRDPASGEAGEVELDKSAGSGALRDRFLFDLRALAGRAGSVRLELEPTTAAGELVTVAEICVGRTGDRRRRLESAAAVPWKVTLAADTRDALLVPSNGRVARRGRLTPPARFDFGLGRISGAAASARVVVERARGAAPAEVLLDTRLDAAALDAGWVDLGVDLASGPGGEQELAVSVAAESPSDDLVWAISAPRVRASGRDDARPNVVLISLDTVRADHLSLYGYGRPTSPRLDAWAREHATVFRRVVASSSWTLPSHFSLFTGLESFAHPANYNTISIDASAYRFLAERFAEAGYRTRAVTGGAFVAPDFGLARGFESFRYWPSKERRDEELEAGLAQVHRILDAYQREPFFLFFHTYEPHTPNGGREPWFSAFHGTTDARVVDLGPPDPVRAEDGFLGAGHFVLRRRDGGPAVRLGAGDAALPVDAYDSALAYTDDRLSALLDRLVRPPFAGRTIVAIVSDHGESLGEQGRAGHSFLWLDNLLVPLIVVEAGGRPDRPEVAAQVRLHDLYSTLLELAGLEAPADVDSRSLVPLLGGRAEPGRIAFTYAAPANYGLGVLAPDGTKIEWRNSPWRALAGVMHWSRVDGFRETPLPAAPPGADAERLSKLLATAYAQRSPGFRLEVRRRGSDPVEVEVVTELVDPVSLKSADPASLPIDWIDVGRLAARLTDERPLALQFERIPRREIAVAVTASRAGCTVPARLEIHGTPDELRRPALRSLSPGGCPPGAAPAAAEVSYRWQGPAPSAALHPGDEKLQDDLRALGYLN